MLIENHSNKTICVGDTLIGPPKDKSMILRPGESLYVEEILPGLQIVFATTPDGLRMAVKAEEPHLWTPGNGHAR